MSPIETPPVHVPSSTRATTPVAPRRRNLGRRIGLLFSFGIIAAVAFLLWESPAEKDFRLAVEHLISLTAQDGETAVPATGSIQVLKGEGLPKALANLHLQVAIAAPQRLWLSGQIDKESLEIGRNGQQIWTWEPGKAFALVAEPGVPSFADAPATSRDNARLAPLALPVNRIVLRILPRLCRVTAGGTETVDGEACRIVKAAPRSQLSIFRKMPQVAATVWIRESDGWPVQIGYSDQRGRNVLVGLTDLKIAPAIPESKWTLRAPSDARVEHVALSHFQNFFRSAAKLADSRLPELGPVDGSRQVIATHGKGRLEMRDGTRVLFLRGSSEEMGLQHGVLMKTQVHDLVDRVLYGVGVGSSFAKGRWFFGEIERCQARLAPFIDPQYLREMDSLALAAGLEKQEIRLANFFPELFHCSGFAILGDATEGRRIYHGRILDYMKGIGLEANAVVTVRQPDDGRHAWVNIGYAGFIGSVTAMNDQHISIGEMGGRGEGNWDGKPMAQLVREVMEKAGSLDEAVEIMRSSPRTCEYFYVIADGRNGTAVGIAATPETFDVVHTGETHPRLPTAVPDAVLLSAGDRYTELVRRVQAGFGKFNAESARDLMTRPVCMNSNIHSVLFAPDTLDFWVANADSKNVASHTRYTQYNLDELLHSSASASAVR